MMLIRKVVSVVAVTVLSLGMLNSQPASAGNDAVWGAVGGLLAGKMISDHQQKKQAEAYQQGADDQYIAQTQQVARQQQAAAQSPEARLQRLKSLKDQGLISESDYNTQKAAIVSSL